MAMVEATLTADGTVRVAGRPVKSRGDWSRADAADERELVRQKAADDAETRADAAAWTRDLRARLHLTQDTFAARLGVPVATVRNWEQGKRQPRGAARRAAAGDRARAGCGAPRAGSRMGRGARR